jgi:sensor histidine kinase YesM
MSGVGEHRLAESRQQQQHRDGHRPEHPAVIGRHVLDEVADLHERLGDMLRYTLKENGSGVVDFSDEYEFTRQYLAFEQLRYEDRLAVNLDVDAAAHEFDVPPFSIQTLAENAVHHAIAIRPEGGSIWIKCHGRNGLLEVSVRDDGPGLTGEAGDSHRIGLRSVRERLLAAFGASAELRIDRSPGGFEARFVVPSHNERAEKAVQ